MGVFARVTPSISDYEYSSSGVVHRWIRQGVTRGPVARMSALVLPTLDRLAFRWSGERFTPSAWFTGLPVVQMTTVGARSGRPRTARVMAVPRPAGFVVVAANFGERANPAWLYNLRANPRAELVLGGDEAEYEARELTGEARDLAFEAATRLNPGWRRFQRRAAPRAIPVMELRRIEEVGSG